MSKLSNILFTLGGADLATLDKAPSDRGEFRARGFAAIVPAILAIAGFTIGIYIATKNLPASLIFGLIWGGIVLLLDVSLLTSLVDAGGARKALMIIVRGAISVAAALAVSSFIMLGVFAQDIGPRVVENQTRTAQKYYTDVVLPQYAAERTAAQALLNKHQTALDKANAAVTALMKTVADDKHRIACEANGVSGTNGCDKTSGRVGLGQNYRVDLEKLEIDQDKLATAQDRAKALQTRLAPEMEAARTTLEKTGQGAAADKQAALDRFLADQGLIPQWKALAELRAESPSVDFWAWVLEILLVAVDLMAVIAAVFSSTPAYRRTLAAMLAKTSSIAAAEEAEAQSALAQRELELQTQLAPAAIAVAQTKAEVAESEHRTALLEQQRLAYLEAERDRAAKARAVAQAGTADILNEAAIKKAKADAEVARIEDEQRRMGLELDRMEYELEQLRAGQPGPMQP